LNLSNEERERWIEALSSRLRRHVEMLVEVDTDRAIESEVGAASNQRGTESAHPQDNPRVTRSAPPPTNQEIEEEP
jgi:hypothetical protein